MPTEAPTSTQLDTIIGMFYCIRSEQSYSCGRIISRLEAHSGHYVVELIPKLNEKALKLPKKFLISSFETIHLNAMLFKSIRDLRRHERIIANRY